MKIIINAAVILAFGYALAETFLIITTGMP